MKKLGIAAIAAFLSTTAVQASSFVNGDFEAGNASGWTQGGGYRGNVSNAGLTPSSFIPGDGGARSSIVASGTVDPNVGAAFGSTIFMAAWMSQSSRLSMFSSASCARSWLWRAADKITSKPSGDGDMFSETPKSALKLPEKPCGHF